MIDESIEIDVFPSPGRVLATMIILGGAPGLERRIDVRIPRSDSAILDIEPMLPAIASSLNLEGRRAELSGIREACDQRKLQRFFDLGN